MGNQQAPLPSWSSLDPEQQTALRIEYGYYLDRLPPTCSFETKVERFRTWLRKEKGIDYRD
jgi:hypothetical protein